MASYLPPGFQGVNFGAWSTWEPVTIDGLPYYQVPNMPQYVFDPYDGAAGSIKINPRYVEQNMEGAQSEDDGLASQISGAAGTLGGMYLANNYEKIPGWFSGSAGSTTSTATSGLSAPSIVSAERISGAPTSGVGVMPYVGAVGAGLGAYGLKEAIENRDTKSGALSGASLGAGLGAAAPLAGFGPLGWGALALMALGGAGFGAGLTKALGHESTRDIAKRHTKSLQETGKDDSVWQNYVSGMRNQFNEAPADPSKPFAGKYKTWDEYKKAGLEATDLTGVHGNLETFGPEWAHLSQDQRVAVTQGLINADLYHSRKGEVNLSDKNKAKEIYNSIIGKKPEEKNKTIQYMNQPSFGQSVAQGAYGTAR